MGTAVDMVEVAASQIGITEYPPNSNHVKYGEWYGMDEEPWCDMFVSWCGDQIGESDAVGKYAYCPYHVQFFKDNDRWLDREEKPQPGDVIFFASYGVACHVGIVESRNGSYSVTTIEGNTSSGNNANGGAVQRRERTYGSVGSSWYILGFGRPAYGGSTCSVNPDTQMSTDFPLESGHWFGTPKSDDRNHSGYYWSDDRPAIKKIQLIVGTEADGYYGNNTKNAVVLWQSNHGLEADGEVGILTWSAMFNA